jgi:hypothetical protein
MRAGPASWARRATVSAHIRLRCRPWSEDAAEKPVRTVAATAGSAAASATVSDEARTEPAAPLDEARAEAESVAEARASGAAEPEV